MTWALFGTYDGEEAAVGVDRDGNIYGYPSMLLEDLNDAAAVSAPVGATPVGPFFPPHSPQGVYLAALDLLDGEVEGWGRVPEFPDDGDELDNSKPPARAAKTAVQVRPYEREGHPVSGYLRHQDTRSWIDALRERLGRPLGLPAAEVHQAQAASTTVRTTNQVAEIRAKLARMTNGSRVEITESDKRMLSFGPEAQGQISGIAGTYVKDDGKWWRIQRTMRAGDTEWKESRVGASRVRAQIALGDLEFARQYRGALLRPLGIGAFNFTPPTDEEIARFLNETSPPGDTANAIYVNADTLKRWPSITVDRGIYLRRDDGWHYYESMAEWGDNLDDPPPGRLVGDTNRIVAMMRERLRSLFADQHARRAEQKEEDVFKSEVAAEVDPDDFLIDGGPGNAYRRQHEIIMQAGVALDDELQRALRDANVPTQDEVVAAEAAASQATSNRAVLDQRQKELATETAAAILTQRLGDYGVEVGAGFFRSFVLYRGNEEALHRDLTYKVEEPGIRYKITTMVQNNSVRGRDNHLVRLYRSDKTEYSKLVDSLAADVTQQINQFIAARVEDEPGLLERVASAQDAEVETGDRLREMRTTLRNDRPKVIREFLSGYRTLGGGLQVDNRRSTPGIRSVIEAGEDLPADWVTASNARKPEVRTQRSKRAHYEQIGRRIQTDGTAGTSLHELVHHIEYTLRHLDAAEWAFWHRRVRRGDWSARVPQAKWIGSGKRDEVAVGDDFERVYSGKVYAGGAPGSAWEILSMGLPSLYGYENNNVVWGDDDYRQFVLGALVLL